MAHSDYKSTSTIIVQQTQPPKIISLAQNCIQKDENSNMNVISVSLAFHACHLCYVFFFFSFPPTLSVPVQLGRRGGAGMAYCVTRLYLHGPQ